MDATLSDEQQMLADLAAGIAAELAATSTAELGALDVAAGRRLLAEVGLLSLRLPADAGGGAASAVEVAIVTEELGRRLCAVPFAGPMIASELLALAGVDGEVLASIGAGRRPLTLAVDRSLQDIARGGLTRRASVGTRRAPTKPSRSPPGPVRAIRSGGRGCGPRPAPSSPRSISPGAWSPCRRRKRRDPSAAASTVRPCSGGGPSP